MCVDLHSNADRFYLVCLKLTRQEIIFLQYEWVESSFNNEVSIGFIKL